MNPIIHAKRSAHHFGGKPEDYLKIHELIDSSRTAMADNRHRALTHNAWFVYGILPRVFGQNITNSDGKQVGVTEIGERHVLEDFKGKFIPTVQDYLGNLPYEDWMQNGAGLPPSAAKLYKNKRRGVIGKWK